MRAGFPIVFITAVMLMSGCAHSSNQDLTDSTTESADSKVRNDAEIKVKSYEFPAFLDEKDGKDVLANVIYAYDPADEMVEPKGQPFSGYRCTAEFDGSCYVFKDGENYGLLSTDGTVILKPDGIKKITAAGAGILKVSYENGDPHYMRFVDGVLSETSKNDFSADRISFEEEFQVDDDSSSIPHFTLNVDGVNRYDKKWTDFRELDISKLDTPQNFKAVYQVSSGGEQYYITFDSLYNFRVVRSELAHISLKIGEKYAECYVSDPDHYDELQTLVSSFRSSGRNSAQENNSDYVQISFTAADKNNSGTNAADNKNVTLSSNGFCLTEDKKDKNFDILSEDAFIDLVNWVDKTVGEEYVNAEPLNTKKEKNDGTAK